MAAMYGILFRGLAAMLSIDLREEDAKEDFVRSAAYRKNVPIKVLAFLMTPHMSSVINR